MLTACSSLTQQSTKPLTISNGQVPCAQYNIPDDLHQYLSDDDLKGIKTPVLEKKSLSTGKTNTDLLMDYNGLYKVSQKQMKIFMNEYKISQQKTEIIKNMNKCIDTYNKNNFDQN